VSTSIGALTRRRADARRDAARAPRALWTVLRWSLRDARRAPLTWGVPLAALCMLEIGIYPSVSKSLEKAVEDYPDALKKAFNLTDISTVQAFLDVEMFSLIVPLTIAFFGIRSAMRNMVSAEERGWLDIVLAAPVSRMRLVAGSFAATLCSLWVLLLVVGGGTELTGAVVGATVPALDMLAGLAAVWGMAAFFSGLAVLLAGVFHRSATVTAIATGALIGMYVIDLAGKLAPSLGEVRYASAFKYSASALQNGLDVAGFLGLTLAGFACAALGALLFDRRDVLAQ
jgi:ABC-2 type transport system permease protein